MVSKLRMTLRRIMRKAKKQKLIPDNPAEDIVLPRVTQGKTLNGYLYDTKITNCHWMKTHSITHGTIFAERWTLLTVLQCTEIRS